MPQTLHFARDTAAQDIYWFLDQTCTSRTREQQ
eukprot:SAG31_NODE_25779_length_454_cov_1.160563_1_plen_32_part_10